MTHPHKLPLSIAPMIDWTNTHFRIMMRSVAPRALLYTEMQTPPAIVHNPKRCLYFSEIEHPLALQLGGADAKSLVIAAQKAEDLGYAEINLNLGCPSDRVQSGRFGACLMTEPDHVAHLIQALKQAVKIPVTAKTRIGIDHQDDYEFFASFCHRLVEAGCDKLIIHARKAWLRGLSPKQNRTIPPIQYDYVYRIKKTLPQIPITINGNISHLANIHEHLLRVDGVMLGRLACDNPYAIAEIHHGLYPDMPLKSRYEIAKDYCDYVRSIQDQSVPLSILLKPLLNIAHGLPNSRLWKQQLMQMQQHKTHLRLEDALDYLLAIEDQSTDCSI
ncbi:MAG: tRNA dihydrouridine(20/20a) synthase DusA [Gammaproteobacteria bacterium]|nr:tRNA dihydrouridine(20/20a) synthase DusA [Gammaproteobacteria bacterium]